MSEIGNITTPQGVALTVGGTAISLNKAGIINKTGIHTTNPLAPASLVLIGGGMFAGLKLAKRVAPEHKTLALIGGVATFTAGSAGLAYLTSSGKIGKFPFTALAGALLLMNGVGLGVALGSLPTQK